MRQKKAEGVDKQPVTGNSDSDSRPLLVSMQGMLPSLNPTERLIAEYVLADPERILSSSISEVRRGSGASVGSIIGFCRTMGARGFADFKISIARELAHGGFSGAGAEGVSGKASLFENVFSSHMQSLRETLQFNKEETLLQASRTLELARRIELFSIGMSYPVACTACFKFKLIGLPASTECDAHMQLIAATNLRKGDLAFAISCSGTTRETVHCLQTARKKGAATMCITNSLHSPITGFADVALYATPSEVKYFQAPLASRITQLALIDALFVSIALRRKTRTVRQLQSAAEQLLEHRM